VSQGQAEAQATVVVDVEKQWRTVHVQARTTIQPQELRDMCGVVDHVFYGLHARYPPRNNRLARSKQPVSDVLAVSKLKTKRSTYV
jgi:hypothetical protein